MFSDMSLEELRVYRPERIEPADFDEFWGRTLDEARAAAVPPKMEPVETGMIHVDTFDVTFSGFGGQPIKAWLRVPKGATGPLPTVVEYIGYGGGRGVAHEPTVWSSLGYAHFTMDSRGQSSGWGGADTPDGDIAPQVGGVMTRGIGSPDTYYYRRIFTDAARAVDTVRDLPGLDGDCVIVRGASQGGGLAIAAAGLSDGLAGASVDVPFLCHFRRAVQITDDYPYHEIADYLQNRRDRVEPAFTTLSYFDGLNFAARASAPALFSVGLMDTVCPPSTVFAAFHHWAADRKEIAAWEFNGHEGGGPDQTLRAIAFVGDIVSAVTT
jgi:cephalosporin-C deacetylase